MVCVPREISGENQQRCMTQGHYSATTDVPDAAPELAASTRLILDAVDEGIVTLDTARRITFMNTAEIGRAHV